MLYPRMRGVVISCAAAMLLATPAQSNAGDFLDCFFGGCGAAQSSCAAPYGPQTYAPAYALSCGPCVPQTCRYVPQTCRYVPQTCYRTVYRRVPVTSYWGAAGCDPCTGCPVTYYRPVTYWTRQACLVPYTTYRLLYRPARVPRVSYCLPAPCDPCAGGVCAPVGSTLSLGCPSCARGTVTREVQPYSESIPSSGAETEPQPETFQKQPGTKVESLKPTPDSNTKSLPGPKLLDPDNRTTLRPVRRSSQYHLISLSSKSRINDGGWQAASD